MDKYEVLTKQEAEKLSKSVLEAIRNHEEDAKAGAEVIKTLILQNPKVGRIDLKKCVITDKGMTAFATALKANKTVNCIDASRNQITKQSLQIFATALSLRQAILKVNFSLNNLGDEGVRYWKRAPFCA